MTQTNSLRVLIVDDNKASAQTLGWMVELMGHEVRMAHDGVEAIKIGSEFTPGIVLLDIGLPNMNGYELCTIMRKEPLLKDSIFIAQTGWGQQEHRQRSKEAGFHFHLVKPIQMQKLEELITYYSGLKAAASQ